MKYNCSDTNGTGGISCFVQASLGMKSHSSATPTTITTAPGNLVKRWIYLQHGMNRLNSNSQTTIVHSTENPRRVKSALIKGQYQQPIETLSVSFAKLLVDQINGVSPAMNGSRKKKKRPCSGSSKGSCVRNNRPVTQIDHVEEWLQQRSAHYAWWRKSPTASKTHRNLSLKPTQSDSVSSKTPGTINRSQPQHAKLPRCILWFQFTGNPLKRPGNSQNKNPASFGGRSHAVRIEQQPLGGANALVFAADLRIGEEFAVLSRRQPGFTFSLTFYIDGVRHARLSGCCENARNLHVPTRVGGPIGAFVLRSIKGGEPCQVCEKSTPIADPQLFTVWPKGYYRHLNVGQESGIRVICLANYISYDQANHMIDGNHEAHYDATKRRSSIKKVQKLNDVADPTEMGSESLPINEPMIDRSAPKGLSVSSLQSEELVVEVPSDDTLVPCNESIEEVYDHYSANNSLSESIPVEDVMNVVSRNENFSTLPAISMDPGD